MYNSMFLFLNTIFLLEMKAIVSWEGFGQFDGLECLSFVSFALLFHPPQEGPASLQLVQSGKRTGWADACLKLPVKIRSSGSA